MTNTKSTPQNLGLCPDRMQRMLSVLQSEIDRGRLPGAVLMLSKRGETALFESLGQQDPQLGTPMTKDSIFRIYSMTKPIVSVAVMMLVEQGKLLLGDPVAKHLPEYKNHQVMAADQTLAAPKRPATVQDLLRHTAGLTYEFMGLSAVQRQYAKAKISSRGRTNTEFSEALAEIPLMYEPGSVWAYSRATDVLGRLVEAVSGETLGAFLKAHIFDPLGMVDTGFLVHERDHHRIAEPFALDPDGGVPLAVIDPRQVPAMESGGGGLMSTAADYAQFLRLMQGRGAITHADGSSVRLLSSATVDYMTSDHLGDIPVSAADRENLLPAGHGFGLGFAVRTHAGIVNTPGSVGQYFWGGIAGTTFFVDPAQDLFAILMIQAPNQRDYFRPLFRNLSYACLVD
jgi:CubicO group peptidase (beta-lactamase class C family)